MKRPPSGRYRLAIGWYRADSGDRLKLRDGSDTLRLGELGI